ncbi:LexA family transcriptional regulator [Arhodomonas sp. AD133]|uniref:LexA family transcriptional regulator n=1 Tax=Arhodomonas sp. AD133 TaxID=3415009 RepID=UPI003EBEDD6D
MTRPKSEPHTVAEPTWDTERFSQRLRQALGNQSVYSIEQQTGIAQSLVRKYLNARSIPGADKLVALAQVTGVSLTWLATGEGSQEVTPSPASQANTEIVDEYALIPRYDVHVSAGHGAVVEREQEVQRLAFRKDWLRREGFTPDNLVLVTAMGDSMEPTIGEDDLILVDTSRNEVRDDSIYVLQVDGETFAKRLQRDWSGGVWIRSDNPQYHDQHVGPDDYKNLKIVGRVVWIGRRV